MTRVRVARMAILVAALAAQGCVAYTVASTAVSVTATAVETAVDVTAAVVRAVLPDGEDDEAER